MSLLRIHKFDEDAKCAVKEKYPFSHSANMNVDLIYTEEEKVKEFIEGEKEGAEGEGAAGEAAGEGGVGAEEGKGKKKGKGGKEVK